MHAEVKVSFVAKVDCDRWLMVLVEEGPWSPPFEVELRKLQERLYNCLDAALDGSLAAKFPQSRGKRVCIRVDGYNLPQFETEAYFERFVSGVFKLEGYQKDIQGNEYVSGIDFEINFHQIH